MLSTYSAVRCRSVIIVCPSIMYHFVASGDIACALSDHGPRVVNDIGRAENFLSLSTQLTRRDPEEGHEYVAGCR